MKTKRRTLNSKTHPPNNPTREPGVFGLSARPLTLSSRLEFVDRTVRKPSRKHFKSRKSRIYKSKHKSYRAIVQRAKQRFGARLAPPQDYTSVNRNTDSSEHLSMFNANYLHVFHQDLDKVAPAPSAQPKISPTAVTLPVNRNESAGATWAIDKTKQLDLIVEDSLTADPQNSCIPQRTTQLSELPVMRNLDLHLSYNSRTSKYDPCPSWLRDEDENQVPFNSTPNQCWINGSGIPVHPPRKIPEVMINSFQDLDLSTFDDLYASLPDTVDTVSSPPKPKKKAKRKKLRPVIIDGNNVALWHGNHAIFSARGIQTCVEFFKTRGHTTITVYVPDLKSSNAAVLNSEVLEKLEKDGLLKYSPVTSHVNRKGVRVVCLDNRKLILQKAVENGAVIISNENYQELYEDARETWRERLNNGILQFDFDSPKTIVLKTDHKLKKSVDELLVL